MKNKKEKINIYFLLIILTIYIFGKVMKNYDKEYFDFVNHDKHIFEKNATIYQDIISILLNLDYNMEHSKLINIFKYSELEKSDKGTFSFVSNSEDDAMYFVGNLIDGKITKGQLHELIGFSKLSSLFVDIVKHNDDFKNIVYISENDFIGMYPYKEEGIKAHYIQWLIDIISARDLYGETDYKKGNYYNITSSIEYIKEYDEYIQIFHVYYEYDENTEADIFITYEFDPYEYLENDKYEDYIMLFNNIILYKDKDDSIAKVNIDESEEDYFLNIILDNLALMTINNEDNKIFETKYAYYKVDLLHFSNTFYISRYSKMNIFINAIMNTKFYIIIFLITLISMYYYNKELDYVSKHNELLVELKGLRKKLIHTTSTDYMTGLLSRQGIIEYLEDIKDVYYVIIIGIDNIKYINDTYGYEMGDKVILEVSKRLIENTKYNEKACRWSGKDFLVLHYHKFKRGDIEDYMTEFKAILDNVVVRDHLNLQVDVRFNIGVDKKQAYVRSEQAIINAERCKEQAKKEGGNRIVYADR